MAIDTKETKNSLFGGLTKGYVKPEQIRPSESKAPENVIPHDEIITQHVTEPIRDQAIPKYQTFDKVTALLTTNQKDGLDRIAKRIMKQRSKEQKGIEKERITANTIMRALIDNFLEVEEFIKHGDISSESEAYEWIKKMFK